MKFIYVDESGDNTQGDIFVMVGVLVDAYRLRKATAEFDQKIVTFLRKHPKGTAREIKTKAFINGGDKWSEVDPVERKQLITDICDLACACARLYPIALSISEFSAQCSTGEHSPPFKSHWLGAAMFIASLVQQRMLGENKNKGHTVFICDDNKAEMPKFSDALYEPSDWFDPMYQESKIKGGKKIPVEVRPEDRFSNIINTGFAIKSEHSSLVQVGDVAAYIYRRHLELRDEEEKYDGERAYYDGLAARLDGIREKLGSNRSGQCVNFYKAIKAKHWTL